MGFAFSKLWSGLFAVADNFKVGRAPGVILGGHRCCLRVQPSPLTVQLVAAQIIIVGLNNAGKTTILYKL
jgi:hypothetical protein